MRSLSLILTSPTCFMSSALPPPPPLLLSCFRSHSSLLLPPCRQPNSRSRCRCQSGDPVLAYPFRPSPHPSDRRRRRPTRLRASRRESPYEVLGVPPSATAQDIKRAYRKLALKFHPDVNKEAGAQEKFMRIKHAYNTLLNSNSRRGTQTSSSSYSASERTQRTETQEEDFYGFGDFFRDLQEEYRNWEATASSQGKPKSLWEELAEIGEELVEFLEKELSIPDSDVESDSGDDGQQWVDPRRSSAGAQGNGDGTRNKATNIEDNIDEIEATLSQLKKELGL